MAGAAVALRSSHLQEKPVNKYTKPLIKRPAVSSCRSAAYELSNRQGLLFCCTAAARPVAQDHDAIFGFRAYGLNGMYGAAC